MKLDYAVRGNLIYLLHYVDNDTFMALADAAARDEVQLIEKLNHRPKRIRGLNNA